MRVKIGCRDIRKNPSVVECLLDLHFYASPLSERFPWMVLQMLLGPNGQGTLTELRKTAPPQKSPNGERDHNLLKLLILMQAYLELVQ